MKRWLIGIALVLALVGGGLHWLHHSLDVAVKTAIGHFAPDMRGVLVKVREVRHSTTSRLGTLLGVEIDNHAGYAAPRAFRAGTITARVYPPRSDASSS